MNARKSNQRSLNNGSPLDDIQAHNVSQSQAISDKYESGIIKTPQFTEQQFQGNA